MEISRETIALLVKARDGLRRTNPEWRSLNDAAPLSNEEFNNLLNEIDEALVNCTAHSVTNPQGDALYWYDRSLRLWVVTARDSEGYQIGDAIYATSKQEAMETAIKGW